MSVIPFEERGGVVPCETPWGSWYQTLDEVFVEVNVPRGTSARDVTCELGSRRVALAVKGLGGDVIRGALAGTAVSAEATWTLEDREDREDGGGRLLRLVLPKARRDASDCWGSLLVGRYGARPALLERMRRHLALERLHREHPGFDFSRAQVSGNFAGGGGGPDLSQR